MIFWRRHDIRYGVVTISPLAATPHAAATMLDYAAYDVTPPRRRFAAISFRDTLMLRYAAGAMIR